MSKIALKITLDIWGYPWYGPLRWKVCISHDLSWTTVHCAQYCYDHTEYPISYPHLTHIRLSWTFKVVSGMVFVPFNLPSVPELPWTFKVVPDVVNLWPPVSKILKPCYHGDILGSTKDVPGLQWYNLIGLGKYLSMCAIDIWWQSCESRELASVTASAMWWWSTRVLWTIMRLCAP